MEEFRTQENAHETLDRIVTLNNRHLTLCLYALYKGRLKFNIGSSTSCYSSCARIALLRGFTLRLTIANELRR